MSSKNYKIIHQRLTNSTRYRDDPLPVNNKYHVLMRADSTRVIDLIEKDKKLPHISMIDRFWGHKSQPIQPITERPITQIIEQDQPKQIISLPTQVDQIKETPQIESMTSRQFKESFLYDERTNTFQKSITHTPIVEEIIRDSNLILNKPELLSQVQQLKRLQLLKTYQPNHSKQPGVGKLPYIINDYHSKSTNPGYSRNNKGNFFTR